MAKTTTPRNLQPSTFPYWAQQSPIDLSVGRSYHAEIPKGLTVTYPKTPYAGTFVGHDFVLAKPHRGTVQLEGVSAKLVKIHLHAPSEHHFDGRELAGEIHLVHEIVEPQSGSKYIVLGALVRAGTKRTPSPASAAFEACAEALARSSARTTETESEEVELDPNHLLPKDTSRWYRYEGSLTTAPFTEVVSWLVFADVVTVASSSLEKLRRHVQDDRPRQPLGRRFVLRNFR